MKNIYYYILLCICLQLSCLLFSNDNNEPFHEFKENKVYNIVSTDNKINIDGKLNEPIWHNVSKIEDFVQVSPKYLDSPSELTQVQLVYDDLFLYIGATLNSKSYPITKKLGDYDSFGESFDNNSDYFIIEIDSDHNHETAYGFAVNAANVKADYMVFDDSMIDDYWDANWNSAVIIDSLKWTIELKIPFSCMRYNKDNNNWGVNFVRYIYNNNEIAVWIAIPNKTDKIVLNMGI